MIRIMDGYGVPVYTSPFAYYKMHLQKYVNMQRIECKM